MFWYESDLLAAEAHRELQLAGLNGAGPPVIFYGSSSFTLWPNLAADFAPRPVINLAFGGSTLAACAWFFDRLVEPVPSQAMILYAGDNDLGAGRHPEEVLNQLRMLCYRWEKERPGQPLCFVSVKPSPARRALLPSIDFLNREAAALGDGFPCYRFIDIASAMLDERGEPLRHLFADDGLHLSPDGYALWKGIIGARLDGILCPA